MRTLLHAALVVLLLLCHASVARAHGTRSVSVDLSEVGPGKAVVRLRSTLVASDAKRLRIELSAPCAMTPAEEGGDSVLLADCPGGLAGVELTIRGLGPILTDAILIVALRDGQRLTHVLTAADASFVLPAVQTAGEVARGYVKLGVVHILTGYDHLLFLLGLVLLLRRPRTVIFAESAFSVSHSISFSATALGLVRVSAPAAEAAIAPSLVLVALDIGQAPRARFDAVDRGERQGILMAFVFGLVHGLGFAGGLREIGLPEAHVPLALLGFAGGVEIGQIAFLLIALSLLRLAFRALAPAGVEAAIRVGAIAIGSVSTFWLIERAHALLSSRA